MNLEIRATRVIIHELADLNRYLDDFTIEEVDKEKKEFTVSFIIENIAIEDFCKTFDN